MLVVVVVQRLKCTLVWLLELKLRGNRSKRLTAVQVGVALLVTFHICLGTGYSIARDSSV